MIIRNLRMWWEMFEIFKKEKGVAHWFMCRDGHWYRITRTLNTKPAELEELQEIRRLSIGDEYVYNEGQDVYVLFVLRETWI